MSPADATVVNHLALSLPDLSDRDLNELAAEYACLPGENAAAVRHTIDAELEFRRAYRHAVEMDAFVAFATRNGGPR